MVENPQISVAFQAIAATRLIFSKFKQLRLTSHLSHAHAVFSLLDFRDYRSPLIRLEMDEQQKSIVPSGPFISPFAP